MYEHQDEIVDYIRKMFHLVVEAESHYERFAHYSYILGAIACAFRCWQVSAAMTEQLEKELTEIHKDCKKRLDDSGVSR